MFVWTVLLATIAAVKTEAALVQTYLELASLHSFIEALPPCGSKDAEQDAEMTNCLIQVEEGYQRCAGDAHLCVCTSMTEVKDRCYAKCPQHYNPGINFAHELNVRVNDICTVMYQAYYNGPGAAVSSQTGEEFNKEVADSDSTAELEQESEMEREPDPETVPEPEPELEPGPEPAPEQQEPENIESELEGEKQDGVDEWFHELEDDSYIDPPVREDEPDTDVLEHDDTTEDDIEDISEETELEGGRVPRVKPISETSKPPPSRHKAVSHDTDQGQPRMNMPDIDRTHSRQRPVVMNPHRQNQRARYGDSIGEDYREDSTRFRHIDNTRDPSNQIEIPEPPIAKSPPVLAPAPPPSPLQDPDSEREALRKEKARRRKARHQKKQQHRKKMPSRQRAKLAPKLEPEPEPEPEYEYEYEYDPVDDDLEYEFEEWPDYEEMERQRDIEMQRRARQLAARARARRQREIMRELDRAGLYEGRDLPYEFRDEYDDDEQDDGDDEDEEEDEEEEDDTEEDEEELEYEFDEDRYFRGPRRFPWFGPYPRDQRRPASLNFAQQPLATTQIEISTVTVTATPSSRAAYHVKWKTITDTDTTTAIATEANTQTRTIDTEQEEDEQEQEQEQEEEGGEGGEGEEEAEDEPQFTALDAVSLNSEIDGEQHKKATVTVPAANTATLPINTLLTMVCFLAGLFYILL